MRRATRELTHYAFLGVSRTADAPMIRSAYLNRAKEWHPDKHPQEQAKVWEPIFARAARAKDVLLDPSRKRVYDEELRRREQLAVTPPSAPLVEAAQFETVVLGIRLTLHTAALLATIYDAMHPPKRKPRRKRGPRR